MFDKYDKSGAKFAETCSLKTHPLRFLNKADKCGIYGSKFSHKLLLQTLNTHSQTGVKPCVCATCGAQFGDRGSLRKHIRTHNGEKPYKCDTCGAKFAQKHTLKRHVRTHTAEKPYICDTCTQ